MSDLTAVSLFAGVGGFDLALTRAGVKVVAAVEIDKKCREVLNQHFPETKLFDDVKGVTGEQLRAAGFIPGRGILTGGFPCQDLSIAGLRKGLAGERSGLFHEIIRLTDELRPQFIILENVAGLLSSQRGKDMGIVITALVERGYGVCWRMLDSQNFGVPQRRRRVFIVASLGDHRRPVEILFESESLSGYFESGSKKRKNTSTSIANKFRDSSKTNIALHPHQTDGIRIVENQTNTLTSYMGTGGNNVPNVFAYPMHGGMVNRKLENGPSGSGFKNNNEPSFTLTASSQAIHGVVVNQNLVDNDNAIDTYSIDDARGLDKKQNGLGISEKDAPAYTLDTISRPAVSYAKDEPKAFDEFNETISNTHHTLRAGTKQSTGVLTHTVRRLTPKECERLQGFPDDWTAFQSDSSRYKMMGNAVTVPVVEWIVNRMVKLISE